MHGIQKIRPISTVIDLNAILYNRRSFAPQGATDEHRAVRLCSDHGVITGRGKCCVDGNPGSRESHRIDLKRKSGHQQGRIGVNRGVFPWAGIPAAVA